MLEVIYCRPDCASIPTCFFSNPQWNSMCYYTPQFTKSTENKTSNQKEKVRLSQKLIHWTCKRHIGTFYFQQSLYFYYYFIFLTNIFYLALFQSEFLMNNCNNVNLIYIQLNSTSSIFTLRWRNGQHTRLPITTS